MSAAEQTVNDYSECGYTVVEDVLTAAQLAMARSTLDSLVHDSRDVKHSDHLYDLEDGHSSDQPRVRRIKDPVANVPFFAEVMRTDRILDAVEGVIGRSFRFHSSKINLKRGDDGAGIEWHQDFAFFPHTNDDLVACGIAIDDADEANGCLLVVPGSHRGPVLDHHEGVRFVGGVSSDHPAIAGAAARSVPIAAGSMSMHHSRLLHGSAQNRSGRQRRMLFLQYVACDAFPISYAPVLDVPPLGYFAEMVVRGEASTSARLVDLEVELPRLGPSYSSIYEVQQGLSRSAFGDT